MNKNNLSVHRELEAIKEAVAFKSIHACAAWLRRRGHHELATQLLSDMIEDQDDGSSPGAS